MLNFQCPSCQSKCSVDDQFRGRKLKCPKCRTRIRHHLDGTIELLTLGEAPAPPPAAPADAAPAPSGSGGATTRNVPVQEEVAAPPVAAVVNKFAAQSESQQNKLILWGIAGLIGLAVLAYSIVMDNLLVLVGAIALFLVSAFGFLFVRNQVRQAKLAAREAAAKPAASPAPGGAATEPLAPAVAAPVAAVPPPAAAAPAPAPPPTAPPPPPAAPPPAAPPAPPASSVEDDAPTDHLTIIE